ncbi:MAG: ion transporter [Lachnospiraceae bacterium]|nr:ion transporter [Lachnospiraceae bacterium]
MRTIPEKTRKRIFEIIQIGNKGDFLSRFFDIFIVLVIICNISVLFLETFSSLEAYRNLFRVIEAVTVFIFCVEYILRIWTADLLYPEKSRGKAILQFLFSFDGIVDLLTILPFFFLTGFVVFRILRVARIFHLFRINAQYDSFHVITSVLYEKKNAILSSVFIILVLILGASLCMYSVEHTAQPEAYDNALSCIWWSVSTVFTVGYGDIYPVTILGRVMAVVITFLGVGAVAIPTGIISAGFVEHYTRLQRGTTVEEFKRSTVSALVDEASSMAGCSIRQTEVEQHICITALIRGELVVVPEDEIVIRPGDILVYLHL